MASLNSTYGDCRYNGSRVTSTNQKVQIKVKTAGITAIHITNCKIKELGGQYEGGESGDWGPTAHCSDPFGNGFCVINE